MSCSFQVPPGGVEVTADIQTDTTQWWAVHFRYLQVVWRLQLTYRLTLPSDELFIPGTSRWCGGYSWHTDWHYPVMSCSFQVPPGGVEVTADIQTDTTQTDTTLQVVWRLQLMYRLTFPSDVLLTACTSRWCRGYSSCTNWHSPVMHSWFQVPPGGVEVTAHVQTDIPQWCAFDCRYLQVVRSYSWCTNWHSSVMQSWFQVPPGGAEVTADVQTDIPQWCAFDCRYLQVVRRLQLMYRLTFHSDVLLTAGTSR